jgi:hypothetical protein
VVTIGRLPEQSCHEAVMRLIALTFNNFTLPYFHVYRWERKIVMLRRLQSGDTWSMLRYWWMKKVTF